MDSLLIILVVALILINIGVIYFLVKNKPKEDVVCLHIIVQFVVNKPLIQLSTHMGNVYHDVIYVGMKSRV